MARANEQVAALLREYAELLRITGGDAFRARNYERAARSVAEHSADVATMDVAALRTIQGVGASIADKIADILARGSFPALAQLRDTVPPGVRELTRVPALGPKRAYQLCAELGVTSIDDLAAAVAAGRLRGLTGFGARSEQRILHGIELARQASGRVTIDVADRTATAIVAALRELPGCLRCDYAGSLRRMRDTIGDVDVLAAADDSAPLMAAFTEQPGVAEVIARGPTKTSVRTVDGLQVDLRVVPLDAWGAALQYFTGSAAHNVAVRAIAVRRKLKLSEYGLFHADTGELIVSRTEEEVYARLGMAWIPPTLREHTGEVDAARRGELPDLVTVADVRGDLHTHTDLTDGTATLERMVAAAARRGYAYYAVTDHAPNLVMQRMTDEKILAQREQVAALAARLDRRAGGNGPMALLHGTELNIAPDGTVDWDADFLAGFDICVASVHSHFDRPRAEMTRRFLRACENPAVNVIGHPLTRKIGRRGPVDVDLGELFRACARTGTALEINAYPDRLDLPAEHIRPARDAGVKFAIDTDAHATAHLDFLRYGVGAAQRGWLTADDVINTWPLQALRAFLRKGR